MCFNTNVAFRKIFILITLVPSLTVTFAENTSLEMREGKKRCVDDVPY